VPIMGCYGIGVGRLLSSVMEVCHDAYGPSWPVSIAPWQVQLNVLKIENPAIREAAENLYAELKALDLEVLFDDRNERPGVQFSDADLLGVPLRLIVSERNMDKDMVEWKVRGEAASTSVPLTEAAALARRWIDDALDAIEARANGFANLTGNEKESGVARSVIIWNMFMTHAS
jgi:prolyl-tRNA synthetase